MFLMWEVGSCCDSLPVYVAGMAGGEDSGGGGGCHYDPTPGVTRPTEDGKRRLIRGRGSPPGSVVLFDPRIPGEGQSVAAPRLMKTDDISDTAELRNGESEGDTQSTCRGGGGGVAPF